MKQREEVVSRFKVEFQLKQHTPIIHFQADQKGATLRATELKPKFDRFLLKHVKEIPFKENANKRRSLDYKVTIEQDLKQPDEIEARDPLFFGNMGDEKKKKFKQQSKKFTVTFLSFNVKVLEAIKEYFEAFLANTNFGTRQSKGFGSFYLADKDLNTGFIEHKVYSFRPNGTDKFANDIALLYQFLRQGINLKKDNNTIFYAKPAIFAYAKKKGWQWEKRTIKEKFFLKDLNEQRKKHSSDTLTYTSEKKYLLRDLFGLSSSQQWLTYNRATIKKENIKIERFKSPITFKVVNGVVYFWADKSVESILDQKFVIKVKKDSLELSTPPSFDFDDFFDFVFNKLDLKKHIDSQFHSNTKFKTIYKIIGQVAINKGCGDE